MEAATHSPKGIIAVPARFASTRLPNKLILSKTGRPILSYVIENCHRAIEMSRGTLVDVVVACDDERLAEIARKAGGKAVMTGSHHQCGTTRIAEAIETLGLASTLDYVVNVQGDEPELAPEAIMTVGKTLLGNNSADMATLVIAMPKGSEEKKANPNAVKAVLDARGRAIYFSRAPIPYDRNPVGPGQVSWNHHLGIYAYRMSFLFEFAAMPVSPLEQQEGLEQLRAIEAGRTIAASAIPEHWAGKGIDTIEDYEAFVNRMTRRAA